MCQYVKLDNGYVKKSKIIVLYLTSKVQLECSFSFIYLVHFSQKRVMKKIFILFRIKSFFSCLWYISHMSNEQPIYFFLRYQYFQTIIFVADFYPEVSYTVIYYYFIIDFYLNDCFLSELVL